MHLLQSGIDITVIALWLGHESTATTHMYLETGLDRSLSPRRGHSIGCDIIEIGLIRGVVVELRIEEVVFQSVVPGVCQRRLP